jgi:Tol biopolymer transport system component
MILDLPPIARQDLVYLSLETDSERVLPRSPGAPSMRFIVGRVGVSSDGRYVAANAQFDAADADPHRRQRLVLHDLEANVATEIDLRPLMGEGLGSNAGPGLSTNAAIIVFGYNSVGDERIFAFTRDAESFEEVSVDDGGASLGFSFEPQISDDGRIVVFGSRSSLLAGTSQVYVRDRLAGTVEIVSVNEAGEPADQPCRLLALSGDGRFVAFASSATNIVGDAELPGESVFLADLTTRELSRLPAAGDFTGWGAFSADGEYLAFPGTLAEDNGFTDVLLYRHSTGQVRRISVDTDGNEGDEMSDSPSISNDGAVVMFRSDATNLLSEPSVGSTVSAWYVYDTAVGTLRRVRINDIG